jgi:SAM-dependent methyltransferase
MDEARIKSYYERHPQGVPAVPGKPDICEMHDLFASSVSRLRPGRLLDVGCGKGFLGQRLSCLCGSYYGIDISSTALAIARGKVPGGVFHRGSICSLPYADCYFDCVVCAEVLEHVPDYNLAIAELARVTRPGGSVLISTPNTLNPDMIWSFLVYGRYTRQVYERPIPHRRLAQAFAREGLHVAESFSFHHRPPCGRAMPAALYNWLMNIQQRTSQLLRIPLGLYLFFSLTKGRPGQDRDGRTR